MREWLVGTDPMIFVGEVPALGGELRISRTSMWP
jgi:hypothetical protein